SSVDDYIPYHYDTELASACGLPAPVVPGNMLACLLMTPLTDWAGEAGRLLSFQHRIKVSVYPGDTVHARATVVEKVPGPSGPHVQVRCELVDQYGVARSEGVAQIALPVG
ncbi:MAG: MaoC family dehydratase, partial [Chloroflexi bacterium]|nr:MaoC family dehydratase [Chloroflexota bacterium]